MHEVTGHCSRSSLKTSLPHVPFLFAGTSSNGSPWVCLLIGRVRALIFTILWLTMGEQGFQGSTPLHAAPCSAGCGNEFPLCPERAHRVCILSIAFYAYPSSTPYLPFIRSRIARFVRANQSLRGNYLQHSVRKTGRDERGSVPMSRSCLALRRGANPRETLPADRRVPLLSRKLKGLSNSWGLRGSGWLGSTTAKPASSDTSDPFLPAHPAERLVRHRKSGGGWDWTFSVAIATPRCQKIFLS